MKKVYCVGMVKNEADIIESYVRYHLNIFDGIVLLDHKSTDRTVDIIHKLQSEGLPIYLKQDNSIDYIQGELTTELINYTFDQFNPDFIFPLDVDEFLASPGHSGNPRKLINNLSTSKLYYLQREYVYSPINLNENELLIPKRITYARREKDDWPKVVVSRKIWKKHSASITGGNHDIFIGKKKKVQREISKYLKLMHFPYRSVEQLKSKIIVGWISNLSNYNYKEGDVFHWKILYEQLKKNNLNFNFSEWIEKPFPMDLSFCQSIELKYTTPNEVNAIINLLNYCEDLARSYSQLEKSQRKR
ncbi:family 2 glycosyl transferase [Sporosarcina globispora]|uniref:Family 2 glycosyl transferase n=1 Tax=Sporosarcina globispora TaxID=1459 RepID=A0A0M0G814_SPOGL|nr:glycosyltransferase family 2 protein [Sporosarcina globispora]KON85964.1 family 2 glycosyl transferase [Sporosarcina globispora]